MNKAFYIVLLIIINLINYNAFAQDAEVNKSVDSINAILKSNPFHDGFNDISFYYTIDVTQDRELIVEMNFDGPFKWVYIAKLQELDLYVKDACNESPSSLCWTCKQTDPGKPNSCIRAEMIFTGGGSEKENATNICVSFSGRNMICNDLNTKFQRLFSNFNTF